MIATPPLWLSLALATLLRCVQIWMPVVGPHSWRQADTAAMARHFADGAMIWWLPQIDWAGAGPGHVESEFPLYPYVLAALHRLFDVHDGTGRLLSLLCSLVTLWLVKRIGEELLGRPAGLWGGFVFAFSPLAVYYGRSVQAESLLLLMAALCVERLFRWQRSKNPKDLLLSWLCFSGCSLIKVMPLLWLGLAVAYWWAPNKGILRNLRYPSLWVYGLTAAALTAAWYLHAKQLGEISGLSFGFWAGETNRYRWELLMGPRYGPELLLRLGLRGLAVFGLPLFAIGAWKTRRNFGGRGLFLSCGAVLLAGAVAPESSLVHEYYQLPFMLWASPLAGAGISTLINEGKRSRQAVKVLLVLLALTSATILGVDYWRIERQHAADLLPVAAEIQRNTHRKARIVSVSGSDPTMLNLARRQGWLAHPTEVTPENLARWRSEGATHIAGSFLRVESYQPFPSQEMRRELGSAICELSGKHKDCQLDRSFFVVPLK